MSFSFHSKIWNEMLRKMSLMRKMKQILYEILDLEDCYIDLSEIVQKEKLELECS